VEGLGDRRHHNPGGADRALLEATQREELRKALKHPAPDGGLWSGPKVALWISQKIGRRGLRAQRGWEYLKKLGHSPQVPRPSYNADPDPKEQEAFKKLTRTGEGSPEGPPQCERSSGAVGRGRDACGSQASL
jgi:transposase